MAVVFCANALPMLKLTSIAANVKTVTMTFLFSLKKKVLMFYKSILKIIILFRTGSVTKRVMTSLA